MAELAVWIALAAYAYTAGGVREASAVTVAQLIPATVFAFAVGGLIRRHGAASVLRWGLAVQSAGMLAAVFLHQTTKPRRSSRRSSLRPRSHHAPRPVGRAPSMVDGPDELTAANVFSGALVSGRTGRARVGAVIMTAVGSWAVFAVMSVVMAASAAAVWRLPTASIAADDDPESLIAGIRATARAPGPRVMVIAVARVLRGHRGARRPRRRDRGRAPRQVGVVLGLRHRPRSESGASSPGALTVMLIGRRWIAPWILISGSRSASRSLPCRSPAPDVVVSMATLVTFGVATRPTS